MSRRRKWEKGRFHNQLLTEFGLFIGIYILYCTVQILIVWDARWILVAYTKDQYTRLDTTRVYFIDRIIYTRKGIHKNMYKKREVINIQ
jgi:hypothetical protein